MKILRKKVKYVVLFVLLFILWLEYPVQTTSETRYCGFEQNKNSWVSKESFIFVLTTITLKKTIK